MLKKIKIFIISSFLLIFASIMLITSVLIIKGYRDLPNIDKLVEQYDPIIPTIIYDINGDIIDKLSRENRDVAKIEEVPLHLQNAFLAIEDRKFRHHYGFDFKRMVSGTVIRIATFRRMQGGSTITQQLAKNAFLSHERKIMRKVKEALITIEIERKYTKNEIIEKYLNEIYFGDGSYGIKTAAKHYLNKNLSDVTLGEAALLAGIPNRPEKYSPFKNLENSIKRQQLILRQMLKFGFITNEEYEIAKKETINVAKVKEINYKAPDFTSIIADKIFKMYTEKEIYEGGLKIYTTLDLRMQEAAKEAFINADYIKKYPKLEGALITIDAENGYVKAIIGGRDFKRGNFNRAIMSKRQPGSSFKPFIYYSALDLGYQMNVVVEDSPLKIDSWEPKNFDNKNLNNMTMLEGIEKSQNIVAIKILKKTIIKNAINVAKKAGIDSDIQYDLTIALGSISISPFELATSYVPFANGGYRVKPIFIRKIEDRYGKTIYSEKIEKEKIFDSNKVALITHMLKNVVLYGSGRRAYAGIEQAGKTGTTNNSTNAWFSGYTPEYVTTIYLGYDNNESIQYGTGGGVAAPIWGDYTKRLIQKKIISQKPFEYYEDGLKNKSLVYKTIDLDNGLLSDETTTVKRKALFSSEKIPVEKSGKYKKGLDSFFKDEEPNSNNKSESESTIDDFLNNFFNNQ
ncbi:MAG: PBP1A family penicillin-binding protein [Fusobacteria bacterium]|nr:PBP1A family penicillin-binding protein [Fusobacteriota bacterium]